MKLSLNWLKEYVELPADITAEKLAYDLTMCTVEVEGVEELGGFLEKVVVGKIAEISTHPKADRLRLATVDVGEGVTEQVVCGASNLREGMLIAFAGLGAKVRWHGEGDLIELKEAEIRGVKSRGMICASDEIGLGELFPKKEEKEIADLSSFDVIPGQLLSEALGLEDTIIEIDNKSLTNRPDLWGHFGIARELSAIYKAPLKTLELPDLSAAFSKESELSVSIDEPELCRRYIGIAMDGVSVEPSPFWMQKRLVAVGQRPINYIVDVTNYVMFALGQPLHAFDARKVDNLDIVVRKASKSEKLTLLDEHELELHSGDLLIADRSKPLALAGVMGGLDSGIESDVTSLVLESANFKAVPIRKTATRHKLRTESSMRFEKALDSERTLQGMQLLVKLLHERYPDAQIKGGVDCYPTTPNEVTVDVDSDFIVSRIGKELPASEMQQLLERLGYQVTLEGKKLSVSVPFWRATGDVSIPEDIVEEVARLHGYDNLEFVPLKVELTKAVAKGRYSLERSIREFLAYRAGMSEVFSYPWCEEELLQAIGVEPQSCLSLAEPPSPSQKYLHPSLVAQLLGAAKGNARFYDEFSLFEMARVFIPSKKSAFSREKEQLPHQPKHLAGLVYGTDAEDVFFKAKGIVESLFLTIHVKDVFLGEDGDFSSWLESKTALSIMVGAKQIGEFGLLAPKSRRAAGIDSGHVAAFEFSVDALTPVATIDYSYSPLPKFPQTECDFSFLFDEGTSWKSVRRIAEDAHPYIKSVSFIEEYRGKQIPEGKKALVFRTLLGNPEASLTSEEIQKASDTIIEKVSSNCQGTLRSQ